MRKDILILTQEVDPHADDVVVFLKKKGVRPRRFHTRDFPGCATVSASLGRRGKSAISIRYPGGEVSGENVKSVWNRRPDRCAVPESVPRAERKFASRESELTLQGVYRILGGLWVNEPDKNTTANSKLIQLRTARELKMRTPDTLITNDPKKFLDFYHEHHGKVIIKTQHPWQLADRGDLGLYTTLVDKDKLAHMDRIRSCPCLFQEYIPKELELRVTVIGRRVFATAIYSQKVPAGAVDWRQAPSGVVPQEPYALPKAVESKLLRFMDAFGLVYGAIDLIVTPAGEYVFLEINPNGQFGWQQDSKKMPLYETFADLLIAGKAS